MSKDPLIYVEHILESIQEIESYLQGLSRDDFLLSSEKQSAVTWKLVIIGESVANIPDDFKTAHPLIPWAKIKAARNVLVHEYFRLDVEEIWKMAQGDLPMLKTLLMGLVR